MYKFLITLAIGLAVGSMYVQYRITGSIWSNETYKDIELRVASDQCYRSYEWCRFRESVQKKIIEQGGIITPLDPLPENIKKMLLNN